MTVSVVNFSSYKESITEALDSIKAKDILSLQSSILLKPNLINDSPHPVTTPVECCQAVIEYVRSCSNDTDIVIAEGCGDTTLETDEVFEALGYGDLAESHAVRLVDLNHEPLRKVENSDCPYFPQMYLPEIAFTHFIISIPVLKVHSIAAYTGALKNMVGFAPPRYYSGNYGSWKKAVFHGNMQQSIIDLVTYRNPDLSIIDATIGLSEFHLGGAQCNPPVNRIIAGFDPLEVDRKAAGFLGLEWSKIRHLAEQGV